jgi:hypothetical protein
MAEDDKKEKSPASEEPSKKSEETDSVTKKVPNENDEKNGAKKMETATQAVTITSPSPSITVSLLLFWVIPVLILAVASHYMIDTKTPPKPNVPKNRPVSINMADVATKTNSKKMTTKPSTAPSAKPSSRKPRNSPRPSPLPSASSNWPTSYRETVETIQKRNRKVPRVGVSSSSSSSSSKTTSSSNTPSSSTPKKMSHSGGTSGNRNMDNARNAAEEQIDNYRAAYKADPENVLKAVKFADALRLYDVTYHDGGTKQPEALSTYEKAIEMTVAKRNQMLENGEETNLSLSSTRDVRGEVMMDYSQKSVDGLLCALYTAKGKVYFMANMFEKAVETYSKCLEIEPLYLDALG